MSVRRCRGASAKRLANWQCRNGYYEQFVVATRREGCAWARVFSYAPSLQVIAIPSAAQVYRQFATSGRFGNDYPDSASMPSVVHSRETQVVETLAVFLIVRVAQLLMSPCGRSSRC